MIAIVGYATMAIAVLVLSLLLVRRSDGAASTEETGQDYVPSLQDARFLKLAERIFDAGDYLWLRDKAGFPELARELRRFRQAMALRWLKALWHSFDGLVSAPEPASPSSPTSEVRHSWHLLWLAGRFYLLLGYAILVVKLFGPYHNLMPSFSRMRLPLGWGYGKEHSYSAGFHRLS